MNTFEGLDYYQILEVPQDASFSRIRQAYQEALSLYQDDETVSDAFFSETEKNEIIEKIKYAFSVLGDKEKRKAYDSYQGIEKAQSKSNGFMGFEESNNSGKKPNKKNTPEPMFPGNETPSKTEFMTRLKGLTQSREIKEIAEEISAKEVIDGEDIRKMRKALGITVDKVFEITRVSSSTIRQIERNDFKSLPPAVYLKGFLNSYAEMLQLPPEIITRGYLANMN